MKHLLLAAALGAVAFVPGMAEAQSGRDASRGHTASSEAVATRHQNRNGHQRGNQRHQQRVHQRHQQRHQHRQSAPRQQRAVQQRSVQQHRAHVPAPRHHRVAPQRHVRAAPQRTVVYRQAPPRRYSTVVYQPRYQRGHYLPAHYRSSHYYIDHRHYGLAAPPPGHRYVRMSNGDAVLIGVATGLITAILAGAFY